MWVFLSVYFFNQCISLISVFFSQRFSLSGALTVHADLLNTGDVCLLSWSTDGEGSADAVTAVSFPPACFDHPLLTVEDLGPTSSITLAVLLQMLKSCSVTVSCLANGAKLFDHLL